jgi:arginyl-tRNA synthetase
VTPNPEDTAVMVEYSSPNTNKLHLGHVRNNLLGYSVAEIIKASGKKYIKLKSSMIENSYLQINAGWQKFGNGETPVDRFKRR